VIGSENESNNSSIIKDCKKRIIFYATEMMVDEFSYKLDCFNTKFFAFKDFMFIDNKHFLTLKDGIFTLKKDFLSGEEIGDMEIYKNKIHVLYYGEKHFIREYDLDFNFIKEEILDDKVTFLNCISGVMYYICVRNESNHWIIDIKYGKRLYEFSCLLYYKIYPSFMNIFKRKDDFHSFMYIFDKGKIIYNLYNGQLRSYVYVKWCDKTHYLFTCQFKKTVLELMCIKAYHEKTKSHLRLPIELWLMIFSYMCESRDFET
jgi:hypothetical protein